MTRSILDYVYITFIALVYGTSTLFRTSLEPITDVISKEFGVNSSEIGILSSCYFVSYVLTQQPWGLYLQVFSCQSSLLISSLGLAIACLLFPFSTGSFGFGCFIFFFMGGVTGQAFTVAVIFAGQRFGKGGINLISGVVLIIGMTLISVGNVVQSHIFEKYKVWKPTYFVLAALAFLYFIVFLVCYIYEKKYPKEQPPNTPNRQQSVSMKAKNTISVLKATFKQTVKMPLNWLVGVIGFCSAIVFFGVMSLWLAPYLMVKFEYSRSLAVIVSSCSFFASGIGSVGIGVLSRKIKSRKIFIYVGCVLYFACVVFIYVPAYCLPLPLVITLNIMTGLAFSCFSPHLFTFVREYNAYYGNSATAVGFVSMFKTLSGFIGQLSIGALLDRHWESRDDAVVNDDGNRVYTVQDYNFAMMIVPIFLAIAMIGVFFLKETNSVNVDYGLAATEDADDKADDETDDDDEVSLKITSPNTELAERTSLNQEED